MTAADLADRDRESSPAVACRTPYIWATEEAYLFVPLVLELIALAVSPGPRRGLQILTWKLGTFAVIATLAVAMTGYWGIVSYRLSPVVIAVIGAALVLTSSLGRWLLVLLIIAAWPFLSSPFLLAPSQIYLPYGLGFIGQAYVLPAALLAAFTMAARRESRRSSLLPPASQTQPVRACWSLRHRPICAGSHVLTVLT